MTGESRWVLAGVCALTLVAPPACDSPDPGGSSDAGARARDAGGGERDASLDSSVPDDAAADAGDRDATAAVDSGAADAGPAPSGWCDDPERNAFLSVHSHAGRSFPGFDILEEFEARIEAYRAELAAHRGSGVLFLRPQQLRWWHDDPHGVFGDAKRRIVPVVLIRPWVVNDASPGPEGYVEGSIRYGAAGGGDPVELIDDAAALGARAVKLNLRPTATPNENDLVGTCACRDGSGPPCPQPRSALPASPADLECVSYSDDSTPVAPWTHSDTTLEATLFDYFVAAADNGLNVIVHGDQSSGSTSPSGAFMGADGLATVLSRLRAAPFGFAGFQILMGHGPQRGRSLDVRQVPTIEGADGLLWETSAGIPNFLAADYAEGACDRGKSCAQIFAELDAWLGDGVFVEPGSAILRRYVHGVDLPDPLANVDLVGQGFTLERDYLRDRVPGLDETETFCRRAARFHGLE